MYYDLSHPTKKILGEIILSASKSESNRALIIRALCAERFEIANLSEAQDTIILKEILEQAKDGDASTFDAGAGGTVMRFLTAYFATQPGTRILTGSKRMMNRPVGILVDALRQLGAEITYLGEEGFPPLRITGKKLAGGEVTIDGNVSSQFVSALLMISTEMQNGLVIHFKGDITSRPYINMTLKMLEEFRVYGQWQGNRISVSPQKYHKKSDEGYKYRVDGDWSAASYWYSIAALSAECDLLLKGLNHPSLQGDAIVAELYNFFGVRTEYLPEGIRVTKSPVKDEHFGFDFSDCPDLAQTVAVTCAGLGIPAWFNGLHTLRIKETDRIRALCDELKAFGIRAEEEGNSIRIAGGTLVRSGKVRTYEDHRMAMSFAPLALKMANVLIEEPAVAMKSYPGFWNDLKQVGFLIKEK